MRNTETARRFRTNPIEIAIFSIAAMICIKSLYTLFYDHQNFHAAALTPIAASPLSEGRAPASAGQQTYFYSEIKCGENSLKETHAAKVRLTGNICRPTGDGDFKLVRTEITNTANRVNATVFTETNTQRFSTDYIPLNSGKNPIHIEFTYDGGKVMSQDFTVNKN